MAPKTLQEKLEAVAARLEAASRDAEVEARAQTLSEALAASRARGAVGTTRTMTAAAPVEESTARYEEAEVRGERLTETEAIARGLAEEYEEAMAEGSS